MTTTRNKIHEFETPVWLRWGPDSRRDIVVPVIFVRGTRRWYVKTADTGETLGWVIREQPQRGTWTAYVAKAACMTPEKRKYEFRGEMVATEFRTRDAATQELIFRLAVDHPHLCPFAHIIEAAYE